MSKTASYLDGLYPIRKTNRRRFAACRIEALRSDDRWCPRLPSFSGAVDRSVDYDIIAVLVAAIIRRPGNLEPNSEEQMGRGRVDGSRVWCHGGVRGTGSNAVNGVVLCDRGRQRP